MSNHSCFFFGFSLVLFGHRHKTITRHFTRRLDLTRFESHQTPSLSLSLLPSLYLSCEILFFIFVLSLSPRSPSPALYLSIYLSLLIPPLYLSLSLSLVLSSLIRPLSPLPSLSVYFSRSPSLISSLSVCPFAFMSVSLSSHFLSLSLSLLSLALSVSVRIYGYLSPSPPISSLSLSVPISHSLSLYLSVRIYVCIPSLISSLCLSVCLSLSPSPFISSLSLFLSRLSFPVSLFLSRRRVG